MWLCTVHTDNLSIMVAGQLLSIHIAYIFSVSTNVRIMLIWWYVSVTDLMLEGMASSHSFPVSLLQEPILQCVCYCHLFILRYPG